MLEALQAHGLPVVKARGPIQVASVPAIVYDKYAQGSKDVAALVKVGRNRGVKRVGQSKYLNQKSIEDLQKIKRILIEKKLKIDDLQFLIGKDGNIVISDPIAVYEKTKPSDSNLKMINLLIEAARENI